MIIRKYMILNDLSLKKLFAVRYSLFALLLVLVSGCRTEPFAIAPRVDLPLENFPHVTETATVRISALPIREEDESFRRFDSNLLLAGVMPVQIRIDNQSGAPFSTKSLKFRLFDAQGKEWQRMPPKKASAEQMKFYEIRNYSVQGYKKYQEKFMRLCFPADTVLPAPSSTQGIIFFRMPKLNRDFGQTLVLEVKGDGPLKSGVRVEMK
ncbi:MAG: hypothetical protein HY774_19275 [Acidobacteria bacterium]|nr:hypothetical protein [Acidobacteriota bacterium]